MVVLIFLLIIFFILIIKRHNFNSIDRDKFSLNERTEEYKSYAEVLGEIGEERISRFLKMLPQDYYIFNDIYLYNKGRTTQIDHIVISIYGIFVIETKNYKGQIYGNNNSEYWTENFYGKKYKFYNPIKQNYFHMRALQEKLKISMNSLISIVVFSEEATLKCKMLENVIYSFELENFIKSFQKPIFDISTVKKIVDKLISYNVNSQDVKELHIKNVQQKIYQKETLISKKICPKCGGKLVERTSEYGNFLGCSNFPSCRFIFKD